MENNLKELVFSRAKRARAEIMKYGENNAIGRNAISRWRVYESLLEEAGLMEEFETFAEE